MLLDPFQQHALVQQADVQVTVFPHSLAGEKPQGPYAIVEVDKDDVLAGFFDDFCAVPVGIGERDVSWILFSSVCRKRS